MRVLMLCDLYDPFVGGLERHVQTLSRELVRRGHEVSVATLWREGEPDEEVDPYGVRIFRVGGWSRALAPLFEDPASHFHPPAPDPGTVRNLSRLIRRIRPDVVHSHSWMIYSYLPLARRSGAKLVHTAHDYGLVCPKQNYLHHGAPCSGPGLRKCLGCAPEQYGPAKGTAITLGLHASARLHPRVDRYLAISSAVGEASQLGTHKPAADLEIVPTFVPDSIVEEGLGVPRPAFLPPTDDYVLFVGALTADKGVHVLLEAYRRMRSEVPLVLLGAARSDTPTDLPAGVTLERGVRHEDVMASWSRAALGVVPSVWPEPLGQVAVEALASGKPVVASNIGGLPDVVLPDRTGVLVPPGDPQALAEAVDDLLEDPERRARLGAEGERHATRFMVSTVAESVERVYAEVIDAPERRRSRTKISASTSEPSSSDASHA